MATSNFTPQAKAFWDRIPEEYRDKLLSNVYCGHCRDSVIITNYTGTVNAEICCWSGCVPCAGLMWQG